MANNLIPVIDVASILGPPCSDREIADRAIMAAAAGPGFMTIAGFSSDVSVGATTRRELLRLFDAPEAVIRKLSRDTSDPSRARVYCGWFALREDRASYFEGIEIGPDVPHGAALVDATDPLRRETPLPPETVLPGWRDSVCLYYLGMERISAAIMRALARGLYLAEDTFSPAFSGGRSTLRLARYPVRPASASVGIPENELYVTHAGRVRMVISEPHVDFGFMTLLAQNGIEGLQARMPDDSWIDIPPVEDALVVNFGKLLERWTSGRIRATEHRVLSPGCERLSIPFFYEPRLDARITPLPLAGNNRFEPFLYGDHVWSALPRRLRLLRNRTVDE